MAKPETESGGVITGNELYPGMTKESSELRWAFIRKVHLILSLQMILIVGVFAVVFFVRAIPDFISETNQGTVVVVGSFLLAVLMLWPLFAFNKKKDPINLIILSLFTLSISFPVGICCSFAQGRIVVEAAILTATTALGLILYTFWAIKRGHDYSFLVPVIILVFCLMLIFCPLENLSSMIFTGLPAIMSWGYIVFDTSQLIKEHSYDEYMYIRVAVTSMSIYAPLFLLLFILTS